LYEWPTLPSPCTPAALGAGLARAARLGASAVHLASDRPLKVAWRERLYDASDWPLADDEARALLEAVLDARARTVWARDEAAEGVWAVEAEGNRWRFAVGGERVRRDGGEGVYWVFQPLPGPPTPWAELALPAALEKALRAARDGLVLVSAPAGEKTPDLMSAYVQRALDDPEARCRIMEFPVSPGATAADRDGAGTSRYTEPLVAPGRLAEAARRCLRRPPGLIVVREIPDRAAFEAVLDAAQGGHLVIGGLPAADVAEAVRSALARFPDGYQRAALDALASSLKLVVSGRTLPGLDGGPLPVWEWLAVDSNVRAVLRDLEPERAAHAARGWVAAGDRSFRQAANELLRQTKISPETHQAFLAACSP
jgi:twitching motility protein PilT